MDKTLALKLVCAEGVTPEEQVAILAMVPEADRAEVQAYIDSMKAAPVEDAEKKVIGDIAAAVTKASADQMKAVEDALKNLTELVAALKAPAADKPAEAPAPAVKEEAAVVAAEAPIITEPEVTPEDLKKMIQDAISKRN